MEGKGGSSAWYGMAKLAKTVKNLELCRAGNLHGGKKCLVWNFKPVIWLGRKLLAEKLRHTIV